ncbi:tyrosine-type recombinase/integrase [Lacipirellula limnantheis]|uniref:Site-specific tyrosine recombinase XerD n=1 Tax=Lacipirellula limnantheis TaxID=2528024 RepID=A0A517TTQ6_9BACT|nr:site-specific integrase [Lacipirellula limnantheis]QDT71757.1 site-specific tyrosine recombinase XerD [Lacipirellula limnantheis]
MARKRLNEVVNGQYFQWLLTVRNEVYQADGRRNKPSTGRHSLGTRSREEALGNLKLLDQQTAVKRGKLDAALLLPSDRQDVTLQAGVDKYLKHVGRPKVAGGADIATVKRYRAVFAKAQLYLQSQGITSWSQVTAPRLDDYLAWLDAEGYAYATEFLEGTTIKQLNKYLIGEDLLPLTCKLNRSLRRPTGTDTYCYRHEEVAAMIKHCSAIKSLGWLTEVIIGLAHTGMRISELGSLSWACVDLTPTNPIITLKDESRSRRVKGRAPRTTKSRRDRRFPIHPDLYKLLSTKYAVGIRGRVFQAAKGGALHDGNLRKIFVEQVLTPLSEQFSTPEDEIGFKDGRLHSFRHYFCSWCANTGVSEQALMDWLGHRDSKMVQRYYHLHDPQAQQQMKKLGTIPGLGAT